MLLTASIALVGSAPTVAADAAPQRVAEIEPVLLDALADDSIDPSAEPVSLIVRLEGPTLQQAFQLGVTRLNEDAADADFAIAPVSRLTAIDAGLKANQNAPAAAIEAIGATVTDRYQVILNGLLVEATLDQVEQIAAVEGVTVVRVAPLLEPLLEDTVPHVGASSVWEDLGYDGTGAVIAVIDTGLDYTHAAFGGEGTREAYTSNDENIIEPGTFPTEKVIGGYDLAGHRYSPNCQPGAGVVCTGPNPDPDPLDPEEQAHGTHVSSIAAGMATDLISAGVAPGASIVALKVFGNPIGASASTNLSNSAMEWVARNNLAVDLGNASIAPPGAPDNTKIDVINLSLGSDWGSGMVEAEAAINAVIESGVTVVASAGNDGHFPYITGSPSSSELALSVANTSPPGEFALSIIAEWEDGGEARSSNEMAVEGASSGEQVWLPPLALLGEVKGELAWYGMACNDNLGRMPDPEQDLNGKIALIERGKCPFYDKIWNAKRHGAIAAVVFSDARPRTIMGCGAPSDCADGPGIPGVMIERTSGLKLLDLVFERELTLNISIDPERLVELTDTISPDSSRGPSRHLSAIKPQISAPGMQIMAARAGTGTDGEKFSGTSMSGPVVTGVAALLWQRNYAEDLGLRPLDISALAMNYSRPRIHITPDERRTRRRSGQRFGHDRGAVPAGHRRVELWQLPHNGPARARGENKDPDRSQPLGLREDLPAGLLLLVSGGGHRQGR
jgi:subtilisin family serine protease